MFRSWLVKWLLKDALLEIEERMFELNQSIKAGTPEHPYGHPHTLGLRDGLFFALRAIKGED